MTRRAATHRRTHHPWWPGGTRVTLGRKRHGLGVSWVGGSGWLPPLPKPRRAPEPHPQPWLPVLAIQSFQASRALWGQGDSVRGWLALRSSGGPRGTCSGHPRIWEQIPRNGNRSLGKGTDPWEWGQVPAEREQPAVLPGAPKGDTQKGSYLDSRGSRGSRGSWHPRGASHALAALQEPQEVTGTARAGHQIWGTRGDTTEHCPVALAPGTHLLGHRPWWPGWTNLSRETRRTLNRRGVWS